MAKGIARLLAPGGSWPVSNALASDVAVCVVSSRFCQVTVSPTVIVRGVNAKLWIVTVRLAPSATVAGVTPSAKTSTTSEAADRSAIR